MVEFFAHFPTVLQLVYGIPFGISAYFGIGYVMGYRWNRAEVVIYSLAIAGVMSAICFVGALA